ncbi:AMP-binding protein [Plantactinospora sp. S1510]|uniref:AMP-binding protein n=1 Tax=Plantactinospora alkalitolerans TaxID=2789879 RepID=A0ABS0H185_9ACTN|nr:AMP-binding protein [Plantactinospora alkalitolerans]MBF9132205.1 AMP-binding protein [Plantactinospora alkalitolerans]
MARPYAWSPWHTADADHARVAVVRGDRSQTFGELVDLADRYGPAISDLGVPDGAVVSTSLPVGPEFFALALATLRYGFGFFPVEPWHISNDGGRGLLGQVDTRLHVADGTDGDIGIAVPQVGTSELNGRRGDDPPPRSGGYLVLATSGTTGAPTAVRRARPWYPYRGVAVLDRYAAGMRHGPHVMTNLTAHLGTLGPALYALQAGSAVVAQDSWSVNGFAGLVDRYAADSTFLSPDRLVELVDRRVAPARSLKVVLHGGASCPPDIKRSAIDLFGPVLHEFYGTSAGIVSEISTSDWLRRPGSVGRPLPGVKVQITAGDQQARAGEPGEVQVWPRRVDRLDRTPGLVRTGDLGYLSEDGYLFILGRLDDRYRELNARVEAAVRELPTVTDVVATAHRHRTDTLVVRIECTASGTSALRQEVQAVVEALGSHHVELEIRPSGTFVRTASGKLRRTDG